MSMRNVVLAVVAVDLETWFILAIPGGFLDLSLAYNERHHVDCSNRANA
jgi:hypothetical protein